MGVKFPEEESPVYPPRDWKCPQCSKYHSTAHWRDERQEGGFVKEESMADSTCRKVSNPDHRRTKEGVVSPLYCPHCGWVMPMDVIVREKIVRNVYDPRYLLGLNKDD